MTYSRWLPQTWSPLEEYRFGRSLLVYDLALRGCARTQPQRDVGRLHRLFYHPYQVGVQRLQVCLIPQSGGELFERLSCVVLPPVEAAVYERLVATTQRVEQRSDHQGRDDYGELWLLLLAGEAAEDDLGHRHAPEVHERQYHGERTVYEGTVYDQIYVEEACAQDCDPDGERDEQPECVHQQHAQHLRSHFLGRKVYRCSHGEYGRQGAHYRYSRPEHYPFGLLALGRVGDACVAVELGHQEAAPHHHYGRIEQEGRPAGRAERCEVPQTKEGNPVE